MTIRACLHAVSPAGSPDRAAPPKPRRSPGQEPPQLVLPPTPSFPLIEPTESNSPQSPVEAEEAAPQCRFLIDWLSLSFTLGLSFSSLEAGFLTCIAFDPIFAFFSTVLYCQTFLCECVCEYCTLSVISSGFKRSGLRSTPINWSGFFVLHLYSIWEYIRCIMENNC